MKAKKIILSSLAVASAGALAAGVYKIAKDQKRLRTQEELVAEVRGANGSHGDDCDSVCGTLRV